MFALSPISPESKTRLIEIGKTTLKFITYIALISIVLYGTAKLLNLPIDFKAQVGGYVTGGALCLLLLGSTKILIACKNKINCAITALVVCTLIGLLIAHSVGGISIKNCFTMQWRGLIAGVVITTLVLQFLRLKNDTSELKAEYDEVENHHEKTNMQEIAKVMGLFCFFGALLAGSLYGGVRLFGTNIDFQAHGGGLLTGSMLVLSGGFASYLGWKCLDTKKDSLLKKLSCIFSFVIFTLLILGATGKIPLMDGLKQYGGLVVGSGISIVVMKIVYDHHRKAKMERLIQEKAKRDELAIQNANVFGGTNLNPRRSDAGDQTYSIAFAPLPGPDEVIYSSDS